MGANNQSGVTFGFTHRFGSDSGGFNFSKFLGLDKGKVSGRVYYDLNGNGQDDAGEPGASGLTVQLNEKRSIKTDADGRYQFSANEGGYSISLISENLGVRLRATTVTQQNISLYSGKNQTVNFGLSDFGFISGRVFNDANPTGDAVKSGVQGLGEVKVSLRSGNFAAERTTGADGTYEFQNLRPGTYTFEIDTATLPANFRLPAQTSREIKIEPVRGIYFDIPIAAQRAISGFVFIDQDGDGKFNPQKDTPVAGASVRTDDNFTVSDNNGAYILRNLQTGKVRLRARSSAGTESAIIKLELGAEPVTKREVNIFMPE